MKRKIMFLTTTWQENYSKLMIEGMQRYVNEHDVELHIFNAYGATVEYYSKETEIFYLPKVSNYDGVVVLFNNVDSDKYMEDFCKKCKDLKIPMMSIDRKEEGIAYCGIDNYASAYQVVEHMVVEHGCKRLAFVGGPEEHHETIVRCQAFKDCLMAHGLEPYSIGYYGYMRSSGRQAYNEVKNSGKPMADCYVCANDFAALGFLNSAKADDILAPRDYYITGFDNTEVAQKNIPKLTSVERNLVELGYSSIEHLVKIIEGETTELSIRVPGKTAIGSTCGCKENMSLEELYMEINLKMLDRDYMEDVQRKARELLCGNNSYEQYQESYKKCHSLYKVEEIVIGVNHSLINQEENSMDSYDEKMDTYCIESKEELWRDEEIVPKVWRDSGEKIFFFASLHCKERTLGYSIFKYHPEILEFQYHRNLNETAAMAVENIRQTQILNKVNQKLECLYIKDSMTGLYNRFGYNSFAGECFKKNQGKIYVVFIDMDNLKKMNDGYGHEMGDIALKGIADAIRAVYTDTDVHVRMGGDEFLVMGPFSTAEDLANKEKQMTEFLVAYSKEHNLPLELQVSMGYSYNEKKLESTGLESLLHLADGKMYEHKQAKKNKLKQ